MEKQKPLKVSTKRWNDKRGSGVVARERNELRIPSRFLDAVGWKADDLIDVAFPRDLTEDSCLLLLKRKGK